MDLIETLLEPYAELENAIRELMVQLCGETCGMCTACCCRADICEEALHSVFLNRLLQRQNITAEKLDDRYGWLDVDGCTLKYGRPPVCYSYYCDEILERMPTDEARLAAQVLGKLVYHIGLDALNGRQLVEIMNKKDLEQIDTAIILHRIEEAQAAFNVIIEYFQSGHLSAADRETLAIITTEEP